MFIQLQILIVGLLSLLATLQVQAKAGSDFTVGRDVINEMLEGDRVNEKDICVVGHRRLDHGWPELFISFHTKNEKEFKEADTGLLQAYGVDYDSYIKLLYGHEPVEIVADKVAYEYKIRARTEGKFRKVIINGQTITDRNRLSNGEIILEKTDKQTYVIKSVRIQKFALNSFNIWENTFEDECVKFRPIGL